MHRFTSEHLECGPPARHPNRRSLHSRPLLSSETSLRTRGGGVMGFFDDPSLNRSGHVSFASEVAGGTSIRGIFIHLGTLVDSVLLLGDPTPVTGGGTYQSFPAGPSLNDLGVLAVHAASEGLFYYDAGTGATSPVALAGDPAPDRPGVTMIAFTDGMDINNAGQVAFRADLSDGSNGGFLATPVSEPSEGVLLLVGMAALFAAYRQGPVFRARSAVGGRSG